MSLPTDFDREIAARVDPPGFDEVLARADRGRRRRRTAIAAGLATAGMVVGLATWGPGLWGDTEPEPAGPTPTGTPTTLTGEVDDRLPDEVRELLGSETLHPWQVVGSGGGVAVVWSACGDEGGCRFALVTRLGDRVTGSLLAGPAPAVTEAPGGWLVQDASDTYTVSAHGDRAPVTTTDGTRVPVAAGDAVVETADGWRLLRGDDLLPVPSADGSAVMGGYVTPAGDLVVATRSARGGVQVSSRDASGSGRGGYLPHTTEPVAGAVVAGHHDSVAVALLGDAPDGSLPVLEVALSGDAGRTWTSGRGLPAGLRDLSALAVSDEGSAYLTTGSHGTLRVDATGTAMSMGQSSHDQSVFQVSHRICVVAETGRVDQLRCSADDGTTWVALSLPGFR